LWVRADKETYLVQRSEPDELQDFGLL